MKRSSIVFFAFACMAFVFTACNHNGDLTVKETNFSNGEVQTQQSLVFTFNNDLVGDSLLYKADSTHYLDIRPNVAGVYEWTGRNQLTFSPFQAFQPSTEYKVLLTKSLTKHLQKSMSIDSKPITFHTPFLKLDNVETFWTLKNGNASAGIYVGVNLDFNYSVAPSSILQKLKLTQNKTSVTAELVSADDGKQVKLLFKPADGESYPCPLSISIDKGVRCIGSNKETEQVIDYMAQVPPKDQFQVENALPVFENGQSYINVTTTQPVVAENIDQYISFRPAVRFKVTTTGNGFNITGDFSNKQDYTLSISGKLRNIFGIELKDEYSTSIHFGTPPPYIAFSDKNSIYLSSEGNRNIAVQLISVPTVKLSVYKVYENNILQYLRHGQQYQGYSDNSSGGDGGEGDDEDGGNYHYSYDYAADTTFGDVITRRELNTAGLPMTGMTSLLNITPADIQFDNTRKGIYLIKVQDKKKPWLQDSKLLVVSDIGMIVKKGQKNIYVFCHSLVNGTKMSGVKITFVSDNNQEINTVSTDADGMAAFEYDRSKYPGKDVVAIIAAQGNDFSFMNLADNTINMSPFDIGGKTTNNVPYDAYMYTCRDIYRPGDTINFNSIIRTFDWHTLKDVPVKFKITMPNGKQLQELKGKLDDEGSCAVSFSVPTAAMTGAYNITMYSGNDVMLKAYQFMVEDFMPQRIKVNVQTDAPQYEMGSAVKIFVQANELFGPPAANKNYQSTLDLDFTPFNSNKFSDYSFNIVRPQNISFQQMTSDGKTDDKGTATISYDLPDQPNVGLLTGKSIVTVFDETGRPVNREVEFKVYTQKVFYGIQSFDTWVGTNAPLNLNFAAADKNGNPYPASTSAYVQIVKHSWETVLTNSSNQYRYVSQEVNHTVFYKDVSFTGGRAAIDYTPSESGEYEVRILPFSGSNTYVTQYFYAYGFSTTQNNSFQVQKEGNIQISAKQASYKPGEDANLLFKCPFDGELVVTVEQNEMLEKYFVHTENKAASLNIPIRKEYLPGVYVSASLIRPLSDNSIPLTIARGFIPIKVEDMANKMNVQITAVDNCHSKTTQTIHVKTLPNADVTIAAVDEGTLLITNFQTPDPYSYFYSKRALEVNSYDIYPRVLPELSSSSMAGDEGLDGRLNPVGGKRVRILSYWSGIVKANGSGDCSYTINIPEFSGSLRVMAVAYKGTTFGSAQHNIVVADPVVISSSLPRFLSPNDQNTLNVSLNNTTAKKMTATATVNVSGPLQVAGSASQDVEIPAHSEKDISFQLNATSAINVGKVDISVKANGETYSDHEELPVRPPMPLTKTTEGGEVTGGSSKEIDLTNTYAASDATKGYIMVSKSPLAQFSKHIGELLQYPYGCMEQTVSTAFPVLYYNALVKAMGTKDNNQRYNPNFIVTEAIKKIYSAQLYNGGVAYWPGMDQSAESWWCTAYALHFLLEAKKSGYEVDNTVVNNMVQFLQVQVNGKKSEVYYFYDAKNVFHQKTIVPEEIFYSLYVLAIAGHPDIPLMNYFKAQPDVMTLDSKYMLAAAYALSGDMRAFSSMLPNGFEGERAVRNLTGSFYSYLRDESISLATLVDAQPDNPQIPILARHISEELKQDMWYSTQENAFALIALGKLSQNAMKSSAAASIWINGTKVGDVSSDQLTTVIHQDITNKKVEIKSTGTGYVYYYYETQGIPVGGKFKEDDSYMKVRKSFYDNSGNPLTDLNFKENELVVVKVHVESMDNRYVQNVAITDIIPACFEIENPRINPERELQWIKDKATPDFMDIRDDRITFFVNVTPQGQNFYYLVRVVANGKYVMGPVGADAMYDDSYHSYSGSGTVVVK